jgi:hydrogenase maturation protease
VTKGNGVGPKGGCVVVCLGNPLMKDDGAGVEVARALRRIDLGRHVLVLERQTTDLSLLAEAEGASRLIIVDAAVAGKRPGTVTRLGPGDRLRGRLRLRLSHELGLSDLLSLAKTVGVPQSSFTLVVVEPQDCTPGEGLSKPVAEAIPSMVAKVVGAVRGRGPDPRRSS